MRLISPGEVDSFLHAANQAFQSLRFTLIFGKELSINDRWMLQQYDILNECYANPEWSRINDQMKAKSIEPGDNKRMMVEKHNLHAYACEMKLGLGFSYGRHYKLNQGMERKYLHLFDEPTLKPKEEYQKIEEDGLAQLLAQVIIGPAIIEVPPQMLDYGVSLGLDRQHPLKILDTLRTVREYFRTKI